jgi:hypothetical protein
MSDAADEVAVRDGLRLAAGAVSSSEDLFDRVRAGVRRRRNRWMGSTAGIAAAVVLVGVGVPLLAGSPATGSPPPAPAIGAHVGSGLAQCSLTSGDQSGIASSGRPGANMFFVPGTPESALVCRYHVTLVDQSQGPSAMAMSAVAKLSGSRLLTGAALAPVVAGFHTPILAGAVPCPLETSYTTVVFEFFYQTGPDVTVSIATGCPNISNGTATGMLEQGGGLPSAIEALVNG